MHGAKGTRSGPVAECSWQCLHCLLASLDKGHLASFLVQCKQCVNEWSGTEWSWMREHSVCYLHLPMHETWLPTNVVSWRSAKLSWSERTWRRHIISFFLPRPPPWTGGNAPFWGGDLFRNDFRIDFSKDFSKKVLTQNYSNILKINRLRNLLKYNKISV